MTTFEEGDPAGNKSCIVQKEKLSTLHQVKKNKKKDYRDKSL